MNQEKLAIVAGVTKQAISKIENGATDDPKLSTFFALCKVFNVRPEWLAFGKSPKSANSQGAAQQAIDFEIAEKALKIARQALRKLRRGEPTDRALAAGTFYAYDALRKGSAESEAERIVAEFLGAMTAAGGRVQDEVVQHGAGRRSR